ncbi:protein kinase, putative [Leishmania panamensis]|uniref:Protein kinase, putative n=2 Tax=Leishmania panamensis TaxID=5679 RepID=A0A088RVQ7_LEIPA
MDFVRAAVEREASSVCSSSSLTTPRSSVASVATMTPAQEAVRQARSFLGNRLTAPSTSSSANRSSGHTESSPSPSLDSRYLVPHDGNTGALRTPGGEEAPTHTTYSTRRSSSTCGAKLSRGVSSSSGGLTRTSGSGAATCFSPGSARTAHSEASLEEERPLMRSCFSSSLGADLRPAYSSSRSRDGPEPQSAPSSAAHSPDAQPPVLSSLLAPLSIRTGQRQHQQGQEDAVRETQLQHVHFSKPRVPLKMPAFPSVHPPKVSLSARLPSRTAAAEQTAVELLQDLSYVEVQEAQEWLDRVRGAKQACAVSRSAPFVWPIEAILADPGISEDVDPKAALLEVAPVSLDLAANLHFSQFFRALLMEDESDGELMSDRGRGAVDGGGRESVGTREAVRMTWAGDLRSGIGPTRHWAKTSPCSDLLDVTFPSPSPFFASGLSAVDAGAGLKRDEDGLTVSPITRVSPPSPRQLHPSADAAAPLPDPSILPLSSPLQGGAWGKLGWPGSPLPVEVDSSTPARRSLPVSTTARRWSLMDFDIGRRIGQGRSGKTFLAREKCSKVVLALKVFADDCVRRQGMVGALEGAMRLQASAGRRCSHIVKLYAFFADAQRCYAALEYADGGDLASHLFRQPHQRLPEAQVRLIVHHVALALRDLHERHVVHRAVTSRNVLLSRDEADTTAKLGDFAFAVQLADGRARWLGEFEDALDGGPSLDSAAPEVICGHGWSCKSDMWALGVVAFEMLCGHHPFDHVCAAEMKRLICSGAACYSLPTLSHTAVSFVRSLLCVDEAARSSAATALTHPFLRVSAAASTAAPGSAMQATATSSCAEPAEPAAHVTSVGVAVVGESHVGEVPPSVSRDLSSTFSLAAVVGNTGVYCRSDRSHSRTTAAVMTGTKATIHCGTAAPTFPVPTKDIPYLRRGAGPSVTSLATTSASPSVSSLSTYQAVARTERHARDAASHTPDAVAPATSLLSASSPASFMFFALPTHPWQSAALPPSVTLSTASLSGALSNEEVETWLSRRPSVTSLRSAGNASRHSPTATLSDISASLLSTTRAPAALAVRSATDADGAFTDSAAVESLLSASFKDCRTRHPHHLHLQQHCTRHTQKHEQHDTPAECAAPPAAHSSEKGRDEDLQGDCSVTVSSLTPHPSRGARTEWGTEDTEVSVSSSTVSSTVLTFMDVTAPQTLFPTRASDAPSPQSTGHIALLMAASSAPHPEWRPLPGRLTSLAVNVISATAAPVAPQPTATSSHTRRLKAGKKRPITRPECALRLAFEALSDEDSC